MNYILSQKFHITSSFGKMIAPYGNLNSTLFGIGFTYNMAKLNVKNR